jgi:BirA family transcriptional regulator, biotin operon repressor / biotin---[acetyl-CoA-carboxylase] ligase
MVCAMVASSFTTHRFKEISSTNDWLLSAARGGAADRSVVVADFQHRGRGRLDRRWEAPAGTSLLASILFRTPLAPSERYLASVAVGLSALEACQSIASLRAGLKWPNDVMASDRKLGGLLAESDSGAAGGAVVVGIGLNLTWAGPPDAEGTSVLEQTGLHVERDAMLNALLVGLGPHADALGSQAGRSSLLEAYRLRLTTLGHAVRMTLADGAFVGTAQGVNDAGHLLVDTADGVREVAAGDVVHLRPARSELRDGSE